MNEAIKVFQDRMDETKDGCVKVAKGMREKSGPAQQPEEQEQ